MPSSITPDRLFHRAVHYLERYAASREGVREVLQRGLLRAERRGEVVPGEAQGWIEETLARLATCGYLNDKAFAETKTRSLRARGASSFKIRQTLARKGVEADYVDEALSSEDGGNDLAAAIVFARKRRFGPFAKSELRAAQRDKHLSALARAGFSMQIARRIVEAETAEALETAAD